MLGLICVDRDVEHETWSCLLLSIATTRKREWKKACRRDRRSTSSAATAAGGDCNWKKKKRRTLRFGSAPSLSFCSLRSRILVASLSIGRVVVGRTRLFRNGTTKKSSGNESESAMPFFLQEKKSSKTSAPFFSRCSSPSLRSTTASGSRNDDLSIDARGQTFF